MQRRRFLQAMGGGALLASGAAQAQIVDMLTGPKTLIDRAIEARKAGDIAKDNEIVLKVNKLMADVGSVKASTDIYEQRLLITGIFDDKATYDRFEKGVRAIKDIKKLYWHVAYIPAAEREQRKSELISWGDAEVMEKKADGRLIGTRGVADVNYRICVDAFATVYVLGRARSKEERDLAMARARDGQGVRKVVDYIDVRP